MFHACAGWIGTITPSLSVSRPLCPRRGARWPRCHGCPPIALFLFLSGVPSGFRCLRYLLAEVFFWVVPTSIPFWALGVWAVFFVFGV